MIFRWLNHMTKFSAQRMASINNKRSLLEVSNPLFKLSTNISVHENCHQRKYMKQQHSQYVIVICHCMTVETARAGHIQ